MQMYYYISSLKGKGEKLYAKHVIRGAQFLLFNQKVLVITYNRSQESQNTYGVFTGFLRRKRVASSCQECPENPSITV